MKVLVACEYSGAVRDAFARRGHDAWSCDYLPSEQPGQHVVGDCLEVIRDRVWDLLIAHPPCTYLCVSGIHWNSRNPERAAKTQEAVEFVEAIWSSNVAKACLENPIGVLPKRSTLGPASQIIQPHQFGHDASKATCLWLRSLPNLVPTKAVDPRCVNGKPRWGNQTDSGQNNLGPSKDRWKERSRTYQGIAEAMASQWSA